MGELGHNQNSTTVVLASDFYVTGGTLRPDAPSYVERQADKDLFEGLLKGEFCYVLTSRQMGKSSLMVRAVRRLRQEGVAVAVLDLTAIGQNLTIHQWYDGLMSRLGQQLNLEDELLDFWEAHTEWGPLQRWLSALEQVILQRLSGRVVIFIDEIDIVRSLPFSTDEFFAAIRECHNRRSRDPAFGRLAFGLLGVATPTDLIRDTRMTPFNIGRRIELHDFTGQEAAPLAKGLLGDEQTAGELLSRVLYWTGGHPYLTQRLCRALAEASYSQPPPEGFPGLAVPPVIPTVKMVDQLADQLFLSRQARDRDDNLIFVRERLLRSEVDVAGLLYLYKKICLGMPVPDDETNPLVSVLRLSGIIRGATGSLEVRNRIYSRVFDLAWIQTNMPGAEIRRQRKAGWRGVVLGLAIAVVLLLAYLVAAPMLREYRNARLATETASRIEAGYRAFKSYQDTFESAMEVGLGGTMVQVNGSGSLVFESPNRIDLVMKSDMHSPELEVRLVRDGFMSWLHVPSLNQFRGWIEAPPMDLEQLPEVLLQHSPLVPPPAPSPRPPSRIALLPEFKPPRLRNLFDLPTKLAEQMGPVRVLPLYRLLLAPSREARLLGEAQNLRFGGFAEVEGQPVRVLKWEHPAVPFLRSLGVTNLVSDAARIPVTAWVAEADDAVVQMRMDLSDWAQQLVGRSTEVPVTGLVITEIHKSVERSQSEISPARFNFRPPPECRETRELELPRPNLLALASSNRTFLKAIVPRLSVAPRNLVDLTEYYNAAFAPAWHPGSEANNLEGLPPGLLQLGGVLFDARGVVQLSGRALADAGARNFPQKITGIRVGLACRQLHFLHAAGWTSPEGSRIGSYLVHYADGQEREIPIVYGEDLRNWNAEHDPQTKLKRGRVVWHSANDAKLRVRLFKSTWVNPLPEVRIVSLDCLSAMAEAAPFLVAITAE